MLYCLLHHTSLCALLLSHACFVWACYSRAFLALPRDQVAVRSFFLGYRKVDLQPTEIIASITIPLHPYVTPAEPTEPRERSITSASWVQHPV